MRWRTEGAEAAAADPGQREPDWQVTGPRSGAVPVLGFLGLRVLKALLWALVGEELAPAGLSRGHAG